MEPKQITTFIPTVVQIGAKHQQGVNRQTYVQNPENQYWYLLEMLNADGYGHECRIGTITYTLEPHLGKQVYKYLNWDGFFQSESASVSPIIHAPTYLTMQGAMRHNVFYARKTSDGKYKSFSSMAEFTAMKITQDDSEDDPILAIKLTNSGEIIEEDKELIPPPKFNPLPFKQSKNYKDIDALLSNLNLAEQALLSSEPDMALLLHRMMETASLALFQKMIPNQGEIILNAVCGDYSYFKENKIVASDEFKNASKLITEYIQISKGCWNWSYSATGKLVPYFIKVNVDNNAP